MKRGRNILKVILCALLFSNTLRSQILINEYSTSNFSSYTDNFGGYSDWIELYNTTASPVNLSGYHLSDKATNLSKWTFGSVTIGANSVLRIWASNKNVNAGINLHTNFKLTQCQFNKIILSNPALTILDSLTLKKTQVAHSRGRTTDGAPTWSVFTTPTPNTSNNTSTAYLGYATTPAMSLAQGFYAGPQNLTLSSPDAGVTIKYTTDGSSPSSSGITYLSAFNIPTTQVIRAEAFSSNPLILNSFINNNTFFISVTHSVNVISIFGDQLATLMGGTQIFPEVGLEYFDNLGAYKTEGYGISNKHGNDSWFYPQRGIDFVCHDEFGYYDALNNYQIFNSKTRTSFQRLIIKAAANDNYPFEGLPNANFPGELGGAHIRDAYVNTVAQKAGMHLDERTWVPGVLYVNGQYWGVYDFREKADDKDFTKYYYNSHEDSLQYLQTWGGTWSAYGGAQSQTDWTNLKNFIVANSMTVAANYAYADSMLNVKSLADYAILNSYCVCSDWLNWNTAWWRGINYSCSKRKWRYSLWDEDATFKHYVNYTGVPNQNTNADPCDPQSLPNPGGQGHIPILNALLTNPTFKQYYVMRYFDLLNAGLSCSRMTAILDSMILQITPEMPAHIAKWGGTMAQWQQNVADLKTFIQQRCDTVTKLFNGCYNVTGPYKIKINVDPPGAGTVDFNSLNLTSFLWSGTYPGNLPNNLKAHAKTNYCFSHWTTKTHTLSPNFKDSVVSVTLMTSDSIVAHFIYNPKVTSTPINTIICLGDSAHLAATNGLNYNWSPPTGLSCANCASPYASPSVTTTYTVTSIASASLSCKTNASQTIIVNPSAVANFSIVSTQTILPQNVLVVNTSSLANSYSWIFSNGTSSIVTTPTFVINASGSYTLTLIAYGNNNCNDTLSSIIVVSDTAGIYTPTVTIPNIFTPNGDGTNDYFFPIMKFFKSCSCNIYDRWGTWVYDLKGLDDKWNGENFDGKPCASGTYFYIFKGKDIADKEYLLKGYLQLLR